MTVKLAFNGVAQFFDANGDPLNGGKLFTYAAGSSTKQTTYKDSAGSSQHANPIILDSSGFPTASGSPQEIWLTTGLSYKFVLSPSTDSDPPTSPLWTADNIAAINDTTSAVDEWVDSGLTPTFIGASSFSFPGDQTTRYTIGDRLKFTVTAGTVYGRITNSVFAALTTITLQMDGTQALDSGLSAVSVSIQRSNVLSQPERIATTAGTDTYTASVGISRLVIGDQYKIKIANTNTSTTPTLNLDGTGAKTIVRQDGSAVSAGDLNGEHTFRWNGTNMVVLNTVGPPFVDTNALVKGSTDGTKKQRTEVDTFVTAGATRVWYAQDKDITVAGLDDIFPKNYAINGSFAIAQRAMPTTDNAYCLDRWRLLLGAANAATVTQDTADVPTGAKYACKLVVGAGNNNKFGIFQPIEGVNMYDLRGQTVSIRVPLKATAGLTDGIGKIRIGIMQWTGTEDSISATPISAWGNEGTNPTLIANWAFANTPAALSVTTSWADYTVENVSISASAVNLGIFIWSDDKTNTQTTDILRVGGYVTLAKGVSAPGAQIVPFTRELLDCQRYYAKTFPLATAPAQNGGVAGAISIPTGANFGGFDWAFPVVMRASPTVTSYNPSAANANVRDITNGADRGITLNPSGAASQRSAAFSFVPASTAATNHAVHLSAEAEL